MAPGSHCTQHAWYINIHFVAKKSFFDEYDYTKLRFFENIPAWGRIAWHFLFDYTSQKESAEQLPTKTQKRFEVVFR